MDSSKDSKTGPKRPFSLQTRDPTHVHGTIGKLTGPAQKLPILDSKSQRFSGVFEQVLKSKL